MSAELLRFEGKPVRMELSEGEPWWVAKDVCDVLGISKPRDAVARLDADEKGRPVRVDTPGGAQNLAAVNESGLYSLILRSDKPEAKAFKRWITHEVLPSIRRTGSYAPAPSNSELMAVAGAAAQLAGVCERLAIGQADLDRRLTRIEERQSALPASPVSPDKRTPSPPVRGTEAKASKARKGLADQRSGIIRLQSWVFWACQGKRQRREYVVYRAALKAKMTEKDVSLRLDRWIDEGRLEQMEIGGVLRIRVAPEGSRPASRTLSHRAERLLSWLKEQKGSQVLTTQRKLAKALGVCVATVERAGRDLAASGLVKVETWMEAGMVVGTRYLMLSGRVD